MTNQPVTLNIVTGRFSRKKKNRLYVELKILRTGDFIVEYSVGAPYVDNPISCIFYQQISKDCFGSIANTYHNKRALPACIVRAVFDILHARKEAFESSCGQARGH